MKRVILFFFILLSNLSFSQKTEIDSVVSKQVKTFSENNISEFFIVEKYCIGCIRLGKSSQTNCDYEDSSLYVFWKEKSKCYFRKIDKCNSSKIKISEVFFDDYLVKIDKIKNESVKTYQTGKDKYISLNHSEYAKYYFIINGKLEIKWFDYFDLTTIAEQPNLNYDFNHSLELVRLSKDCDKIIFKNR